VQHEWNRIFDALPVPAWTAFADGRADFINACWCEYTGLGFDEALGQGWQMAIHPDDLSALLAGWHAMAAAGAQGELEVRMRQCDGDYRWFLLRMGPLTDASGRVEKWCGITTDIDQRKRLEQAAPKALPDLRAALDSMPVPAAVTTRTGKLLRINQATREYFGKTFSQLKSLKPSDVVHPDDLPYILGAQSKAYESGSTYNVQSRHRRSDGVYRWFNVIGMPWRDGDGEIACWLHLLIDIDDQRRPEEALRTAERNLHATIHTIPALVWSARTDGSAEFFNQHYLDYVGLTAEQALGWGWMVAVHPDDVDNLTVSWRLILASHEPGEIETRLRRCDGEYRWFLFRVNPLRNEYGGIIRWYGISIDIDDRKRADEKLRRSEAFLADGQRISLTGSFSWCLDSDEIVFSEELYRIFGFAQGSTVTLERITDRVHPDDMPLLTDKRIDARTAGNDHDYEIRLLMPNGSVKHVHIVSHSTRGRYGREYLGAVQDVTQRRNSEETLGALRAELASMTKINSLGVLTASIAHEVNQPLSGVITNASTCLRQLAADPPCIEGAIDTAKRTIRDGHRAADVMTRVRALFSNKATVSEWVNLNDATREVIALSQSTLKSSRVMLKAELLDDMPLVMGDRVQLQQVILNLLMNAAEAMREVDDRPRQVVIRTERDSGDRVRLTVRDSGVGFGPKGVSKLFDTFYTTKDGGMGIGLSISQSIIERHQGRLWAAPNDGPGVSFWFSIPRASQDEPATQTATTGTTRNTRQL